MAKLPSLKVPEEFQTAVEEILGAAADEIPGKGVAKRLWGVAQKKISKQERQKIKEHEVTIKKMYDIIDSHAKLGNQLSETNELLLAENKKLKKKISDFQAEQKKASSVKKKPS